MEGQARWCRFLSCLLSHLFYILLRRFTKRKRSPDVEAADGYGITIITAEDGTIAQSNLAC